MGQGLAVLMVIYSADVDAGADADADGYADVGDDVILVVDMVMVAQNSDRNDPKIYYLIHVSINQLDLLK